MKETLKYLDLEILNRELYQVAAGRSEVGPPHRQCLCHGMKCSWENAMEHGVRSKFQSVIPALGDTVSVDFIFLNSVGGWEKRFSVRSCEMCEVNVVFSLPDISGQLLC